MIDGQWAVTMELHQRATAVGFSTAMTGQDYSAVLGGAVSEEMPW